MSHDSQAIKKLFKIIANQQQVLTKLAQTLPTRLEPQVTSRREAETILNSLPANVRTAVDRLETHPSTNPNYYKEIRIRFHPGQGTPGNMNAVQKVIRNLSSENKLPGSSYSIRWVS